MAAASTPLSAEAQKELLLGMGLPFESWRADVPLGDFEGVSVGEDGLIVGLDFGGEEDVAFKLGDFAPMVSLRELNISGTRTVEIEAFVEIMAMGDLKELILEGEEISADGMIAFVEALKSPKQALGI